MSYRSHADIGGAPVTDRVVPEPEGTPFHGRWEQRVHALTLAMGATGSWNLDQSRATRETLPDYATLGYYGRWLGGLERLLLERGLVTERELASGELHEPPRSLARVLRAADVAAVLARGAPTGRAALTPARFAVGHRVRLQREPAAHHTRLPAYARGHCGIIERAHGAHVFADRHAHGLGEQPQWLYTVVLSARDLWGEQADARDRVSIDAWEPYLEPA
ncbi:MAG: nitrile hydratase subunit beta [Proteobacteria bacterium]|nr:nitrile hydratase subunit beta [Pseudomonadota bacterium]